MACSGSAPSVPFAAAGVHGELAASTCRQMSPSMEIIPCSSCSDRVGALQLLVVWLIRQGFLALLISMVASYLSDLLTGAPKGATPKNACLPTWPA